MNAEQRVRCFQLEVLLASSYFLRLLAACVLILGPMSRLSQAVAEDQQLQWYRGNLHTHSLWSDGNDFPEMIVDWYVQHGYHFLGISDHNILARGEKWISLNTIGRRGGDANLERYKSRFGEDWVETRQTEQGLEVRLKPLAEYRGLFERPEQFILLEAEEITDAFERYPVHVNASNLIEYIRPQRGNSVQETLANNLRAIREQSQRTGKPILGHVNHPNYGWAITAEDLAAVPEARFFEVYNGHPSVKHLGDKLHVSVEQMWDIANTLRLTQKQSPLYGLATDDSHTYFDRYNAPGRGWVWVRAARLEADELVRAMFRGDFYASTGVKLAELHYDSASRVLTVAVEAEPEVEYTIQFIGTPIDFDPQSQPVTGNEGQDIRATRRYTSDVGRVLACHKATTKASYHVSGKELYVRAVVTSNKPHPNPSFEGQTEQAWTQPFGWESR